jgi:hypothetical protein
VKPTLQIDDESLPNVFVCGDVADTNAANPNSRIAGRQAEIAADNVVLAARGKKPSYTYKPAWGDGIIKLTLGLVSAAPPENPGFGADKNERAGPFCHSLLGRQVGIAVCRPGDGPGLDVRWDLDSSGGETV